MLEDGIETGGRLSEPHTRAIQEAAVIEKNLLRVTLPTENYG
jgi:hypothetical protein